MRILFNLNVWLILKRINQYRAILYISKIEIKIRIKMENMNNMSTPELV
jgi:hypothetical protein